MNVTVIGLGYIGLPTAALIASKRIRVIGVDINKNIVETVNKGKAHFLEKDLHKLVKNAVKDNNLIAKAKPVVSDVFIIAVPTPLDRNNEPDISYVISASKSISKIIKNGDLIILESTSPVGTTEIILKMLKLERPDLNFPSSKENKKIDDQVSISYCPERVLPGNTISELIKNNRVIGGITTNCALKAKKFYKLFVEGECEVTDTKTAELSKLVENAYRDVNIAFANELSLICDNMNLNVWNLIDFANKHPRVSILKPSAGVGGHCIAIDPWFIINSSPKYSKLIKTARKVNKNKTKNIIQKVRKIFKRLSKVEKKLSFACFGLTYKPDVNDIRESPSIKIAESIQKLEIDNLYLVDPYLLTKPLSLSDKKTKLVEKDEAINNSDVLIFLVGHKEFKIIDKDTLDGKIILDAYGFLS